LFVQANVRKYVAYVHRSVFWSNLVYFVCLISVCLFIPVCFHCLPEMANKDEYMEVAYELSTGTKIGDLE